MTRYHGDFDWRINDIPCQIEILSHHRERPVTKDKYKAQTPEDLYGVEEIEYQVLDWKGYPAEWLERKLTDLEDSRIRSEIIRQEDEREEDARTERAIADWEEKRGV